LTPIGPLLFREIDARFSVDGTPPIGIVNPAGGVLRPLPRRMPF
jgi:hypothetical protein